MKIEKIVEWLDRKLGTESCPDVSNNGLQIDRVGSEVDHVAFGVDASSAFFRAAAKAGAQLCVVHHGISWGGGIQRLTGGVGSVVRTAMDGNLALYAVHLPLDAHPTLGNNAQLAKLLGLKGLKPAFVYHGVKLGFTGVCDDRRKLMAGLRKLGYETNGQAASMFAQRQMADAVKLPRTGSFRVGVCSGGAGEFAEEAQRLGCALYVTGEANWAEKIAAANCGMEMVSCGHYETETLGVQALAAAMRRELKIKASFLNHA